MILESKEYRATCPHCSAQRTVPLIPSLAESFPPVFVDGVERSLGISCDTCIEAKARELHATRASSAVAEAWIARCPFEFRTVGEGGATYGELVDRVKLTEVDDRGSGAFHPVNFQDWNSFASSKLPVTLLLGPPGSMKTRLAWRIARTCFDANTHRLTSFLFQSSWDFQARLQDEAGKFNAFRWVRSQIDVPLWILDDLCKTDWTDNTAAAFFEILDQRIARHVPVLITGNHSGADLKAWFQASRSPLLRDSAEAILRRLREHGRVLIAQKP